jgi:AcrR family transcriptional regulator
LSMRAVATRLRTGPASLYVYVANKEELLELVFDELVSRVAIPPAEPANWQQQLRQVLIDLRTVLRTHSAVALAGLGRIPISAKSLVNAEGVLAIMHAGGLPPRVTALGADLLALYVIAGVFEDSLFDRDGLSDSEIGSYVEEISEFYRALPADQFPTIALLSTALTADDGEARFLFGLDVLIAGLVTLGERETKAADRPPEAL